MSSIVNPLTGQAKRLTENTVRAGGRRRPRRRRSRRAPCRGAVSKAVGQALLGMPGRTTMRSTTASTVVFGLACSAPGTSAISYERAVHLRAGEPAALQIGQLLAVFALSIPHHWRQQQQPSAVFHRHHAIDHLR